MVQPTVANAAELMYGTFESDMHSTFGSAPTRKSGNEILGISGIQESFQGYRAPHLDMNYIKLL
jgi:hypothetical protein